MKLANNKNPRLLLKIHIQNKFLIRTYYYIRLIVYIIRIKCLSKYDRYSYTQFRLSY